MTNAEKYKEIFGFAPDRGNCPADDCTYCPINSCVQKGPSVSIEWWSSEYKGAGHEAD